MQSNLSQTIHENTAKTQTGKQEKKLTQGCFGLRVSVLSSEKHSCHITLIFTTE